MGREYQPNKELPKANVVVIADEARRLRRTGAEEIGLNGFQDVSDQ
jgi:hypothetical protein